MNAYGDEISSCLQSEVDGQDDIQWYTATKTGNGIYKVAIDTQKRTLVAGFPHTCLQSQR